jgi:uncharacterized OsmC-like protein
MNVAAARLADDGWPGEVVSGMLAMMEADSLVARKGPETAWRESILCESSEGDNGLKSETVARHHRFTIDEPLPYGTDTAPNPIEVALGALGVSLQVTARLYAVHWGLTVRCFRTRIEAEFDMRSFFAIEGVPAGLARIEANLFADTDMEDDQLRRLANQVERCCPVYGMLGGWSADPVIRLRMSRDRRGRKDV